MKNALLGKIEQEIMARVPPDKMADTQKIVAAGMQVMHSPQSHDLMVKQLSGPGDIADKAGEGIAKLMGLLYNQSRRTMPIGPAIAAAQVLLCDGLDFLEQAKQLKVTNELVAEATKSMASNLLQLFGVTKPMLEKYTKVGIWQKNKQKPTGIIGQARAQ